MAYEKKINGTEVSGSDLDVFRLRAQVCRVNDFGDDGDFVSSAWLCTAP
jgi:hypothetical protein